jgi:hypothetical protein
MWMYGEQIAEVIRGVLIEVGVSDRPEVPGIIRRHLELVAGGNLGCSVNEGLDARIAKALAAVPVLAEQLRDAWDDDLGLTANRNRRHRRRQLLGMYLPDDDIAGHAPTGRWCATCSWRTTSGTRRRAVPSPGCVQLRRSTQRRVVGLTRSNPQGPTRLDPQPLVALLGGDHDADVASRLSHWCDQITGMGASESRQRFSDSLNAPLTTRSPTRSTLPKIETSASNVPVD